MVIRHLFLLLLFPLVMAGQAFRPDQSTAGKEGIWFNPAFIQEQKMLFVTVEFSRKQEGERIENLQRKFEYTFNVKGQVTNLVKIERPLFVNPDTTIIRSYYNELGSIKIRRTAHKNLFSGEYFEYDSMQNLLSLAITNENNAGTDPENFKPAQQQITFLETYSYEKLSPEQTKVRIMNDAGILYKQGIIYNQSGYIIEKDYRYVITGIRFNEKFVYDDKKRLVEYIYYTDASGELEERKKYQYEDNGNLKITDLYRNGEHTNQIFHFYDKKGLFPEGDVNKEMRTGILYLTSYKFRNSDQTEPLPGKKSFK